MIEKYTIPPIRTRPQVNAMVRMADPFPVDEEAKRPQDSWLSGFKSVSAIRVLDSLSNPGQARRRIICADSLVFPPLPTIA